MTSLEPPPERVASLRINLEFLMRQLPVLAEVKRNRVTWDELGANITRKSQTKPATRIRRKTKSLKEDAVPLTAPAAECWPQAKELLHRIMATVDTENEPVRKRLRDFNDPSTAALFSTLSLYLAGKLGVSLSLSQPLLAVMLYAVHQASGNWDVLLD
jgi:hypothetical protein